MVAGGITTDGSTTSVYARGRRILLAAAVVLESARCGSVASGPHAAVAPAGSESSTSRTEEPALPAADPEGKRRVVRGRLTTSFPAVAPPGALIRIRLIRPAGGGGETTVAEQPQTGAGEAFPVKFAVSYPLTENGAPDDDALLFLVASVEVANSIVLVTEQPVVAAAQGELDIEVPLRRAAGGR
jgi:hypothetical protein